MHDQQSQRAALWGRPVFWIAVLSLGAIAIVYGLFDRAALRPDVLIITIDTLRADAVTAEDAPAMVALGERGTWFARARAPVPLTLPSHATLLSGMDPPVHGVRGNTAAPLPDRDARPYTLLAEEFGDAGYATAAFVASAVLDPRYRLDQGFDEYRNPPRQAAGAAMFRARSAEEQVEAVKRWMDTRREDRPFFVWVHLWEPHAPYRPYAGDASGRAGTVAADPAPVRYAGEVRRADAAVEALLSMVDAETTVVVLTSDHGESLGAHGESTHGYLCYGATLDIPLILAGPGVGAGVEEERLATLADVAPTLRRLAGLDPRRGDGVDLAELPDDRVLVGESLYAHRLYRWAQQSVAYDGRYSLVDGGPRLEMFDRAEDPGERAPLADPAGTLAYERLDRALIAYRRRRGPGERSTELAPPVYYYGTPFIRKSTFLPVEENRRLPAVGERLDEVPPALNRITAAIAAGNAPLVRAGLKRLRELEKDDPANPALPLAAGRAQLLVLREPAAAAAALERAIRLGYDSPGVYRLLERAYVAAGDEAGAARARDGKKRDR